MMSFPPYFNLGRPAVLLLKDFFGQILEMKLLMDKFYLSLNKYAIIRSW